VNQLTIQVAYVNPPDPARNRPSANIKDANGQMYILPDPQHVAWFQKGQTYQIGYEQRGKYFYLLSVNGQQIAQPQSQAPQAPAPMPQQPMPMPQPMPPQPMPPQPARQDLPPIVSNVLAHAIQAGAITSPEQMCEWAAWLHEAEMSYRSGPVKTTGNLQDGPGVETGDPGPMPPEGYQAGF
jgi:hypothetical protein